MKHHRKLKNSNSLYFSNQNYLHHEGEKQNQSSLYFSTFQATEDKHKL